MTIHQHRKIVNGTCRQCGALFVGLKTKRYCSESCKQKAKRARDKRYLKGTGTAKPPRGKFTTVSEER